MPTCRPRLAALPIVLAAFILAPPAAGIGSADTAALQVALRARGLYSETIDGARGPATTAALKAFQRRAGLPATGVLGPRTRRALGNYARHRLGARELRRGAFGWDVTALQFLLAWHGFPSGTFDGRFGPHLTRALRQFERWVGLPPDGVAGAAVVAALRAPLPRSPLGLAWPLRGRLGDLFGPRGARFHAGLDIVAAVGTPVEAAAPGRVAYAGWLGGGWGYLVSIAHGGSGVRTLYAHLSRVSVRLGERVTTGQGVGRVGATGDASGPHLHFEVRVRGAAVDPLTALG
jgi:murein DD-endopeptidase MepM/ murein hydrolase activator NlpD